MNIITRPTKGTGKISHHEEILDTLRILVQSYIKMKRNPNKVEITNPQNKEFRKISFVEYWYSESSTYREGYTSLYNMSGVNNTNNIPKYS